MQIKSPNSTLDWPVTFTLEAGETLTGVPAWTVSPAETGGIAVVAASPAFTGGVAACLLTGGIFRHVYEVSCTVTTSQGRTHCVTSGFRIGPVEPI